MGGPCRLEEQPRDAWEGGGSQGFVLFSHITSLGNNVVKKRVSLGTGDAEPALSGWRRAPRRGGLQDRELLFDKGKLKIAENKTSLLGGIEPGALQRLQHPGDNQSKHRGTGRPHNLMDPQALRNLWQQQAYIAILEKRLVINFILT